MKTADFEVLRDVTMATIFRLSIYGVHIGGTRRIRLDPPCAAAMRPYVKLLWPCFLLLVKHLLYPHSLPCFDADGWVAERISSSYRSHSTDLQRFTSSSRADEGGGDKGKQLTQVHLKKGRHTKQ